MRIALLGVPDTEQGLSLPFKPSELGRYAGSFYTFFYQVTQLLLSILNFLYLTCDFSSLTFFLLLPATYQSTRYSSPFPFPAPLRHIFFSDSFSSIYSSFPPLLIFFSIRFQHTDRGPIPEM